MRSPYRTRPDTIARLTLPSGIARRRSPTLVTLPCASTRTGTASTYKIGSRSRAASRSSDANQPLNVCVDSLTGLFYRARRQHLGTDVPTLVM